MLSIAGAAENAGAGMVQYPPLTPFQTAVTLAGLAIVFGAVYLGFLYARRVAFVLSAAGMNEDQVDNLESAATTQAERDEAKAFLSKYGRVKLVRVVPECSQRSGC